MSSIAANGGTVRRADEAGRSQLTLRVASALVLAPAVVACIYFGSPGYHVLVGAAVAVMAWEWARLCHDGGFAPDGLLLPVVSLAALVAAALGHLQPAAWISALGSASWRAGGCP